MIRITKKITLITAIIFILIMALAVLLLRTVTKKPVVETTEVAGIVQISKDGFVPGVIKVKKGESVKWTNTDASSHWVASDPHPTHNNLAGFDAQKALLTNESYAYTFNEAGTFTYHDHLDPLKFSGTVIVE